MLRVADSFPELLRVGLGAMPLSLKGRPPRSDAISVIRAGVESGVNLIDTADSYALDQTEIGHSERLIAEALSDLGTGVDDRTVIVATKGGRTRDGGEWGLNGDPDHLRAACHASLEALRVDCIPLYQLHAPDPRVPFSDSVGALARLREEGKIEVVGLSNVTVPQIEEARAITPIGSVQNALSVWDVGYTTPKVIRYCQTHGILFLAYSPFGGADRAAGLSQSPALSSLAEGMDVTPHQLALAWLLSISPVVLPIPGSTRAERVQSNAAAAHLALDSQARRRVRAALRTLPGHRGLMSRVAGRLGRLVAR